MRLLDSLNQGLTRMFIRDFDNTDNHQVRIKYGLLAGWVSIISITLLFSIKLYLGLKADSISIIANAFHLLSHLANSIILIVSFFITARPATSKNPFGHGRMEHVAPLVMSILLLVSGIQIAERSLHQALEPHDVHYFPALIWILLASILLKQFLAQFVHFLGKRVKSNAIRANAHHHTIEGVMSFAVICGLFAGHTLHRPALDGIIGMAVSLWLFYLGFTHAKEAIVPLLGQAPDPDMIRRIREISKSVDGIYDVHEIIVHNYGSQNMISMHVEIPEKCGPFEIHEITERCENELRKVFGGEVICHSDPMLELTPTVLAIEEEFKNIIARIPEILRYHDFRVIAESKHKNILVADIDAGEHIPESEFAVIKDKINKEVAEQIQDIAYCSFYITPKYSY